MSVMDRPYPGLIWASFMTSVHFRVSSVMSLPKSAAELARTVPPRSEMRCRSLGSARACIDGLVERLDDFGRPSGKHKLLPTSTEQEGQSLPSRYATRAGSRFEFLLPPVGQSPKGDTLPDAALPYCPEAQSARSPRLAHRPPDLSPWIARFGSVRPLYGAWEPKSTPAGAYGL